MLLTSLALQTQPKENTEEVFFSLKRFVLLMVFKCSISTCNNTIKSSKNSLKHIYHEPTYSSKEFHSIEYQYVYYHLFKKSSQRQY